jgi:hypothetical protein
MILSAGTESIILSTGGAESMILSALSMEIDFDVNGGVASLA